MKSETTSPLPTDPHASPQADFYFNPLSSVLGLAMAFVAAFIVLLPMWSPVAGRLPTWFAVALLLSLVGVHIVLAYRPVFRPQWCVGRDTITSTQQSRSGPSSTAIFDNTEFTSITSRGPFVRVMRKHAGPLLWPRWLWRKGGLRHWVLTNERLSLRRTNEPDP